MLNIGTFLPYIFMIHRKFKACGKYFIKKTSLEIIYIIKWNQQLKETRIKGHRITEMIRKTSQGQD